MELRRLLIAVLMMPLAVVGWSGPASAQADGDTRAEIERIVDSARDDLDIPGLAYVVVSDGEVVARGGSGVADRDSGEPVDPARTVFRVGSVSKPMTALAVLLSADEGLVDLDARVDDHVDVDLGGSSPVTVGSLLTHTAGFEANSIGLVADDAESVAPLGDYVAANVPSRFEETGVVHSYSNYGYAVAGHLVESVNGAEFSAYMDRKLFGPLGMSSTSFDLARPDHLATGYDGLAGSRVEAVDVYLRPYPAGGAVTTADDMAELLLAMLGHRPDIVPPPVADQLQETGFRSHPEVPGRTVGGLEELTINGNRVVGHNGDIAGFGAQLALVPDHDIGIFFAANAVDFELNDRLLHDIVGLLVEPRPRPDPELVDLSADQLEEFAGSYRWTRHSRTRVDKILAIFPTHNFAVSSPGDGSLVLEIGGVDERWTYRPIDDLAFARIEGDKTVVDGIVVDPGDRISFTRNGDGDIAYVNFSMATIAGERTPGYLMGPTQTLLITVVLGVFLLGLVIWAIASWRHRRRAGGATDPEGRIRTAVLVLVAGVLVGMVATILGLLGPVPFGLPPAAVIGIGLVTIASTLGLALIPTAVIVWRRNMLSITERLTVTALAVAAPVLLWWLTYWNLFGIML